MIQTKKYNIQADNETSVTKYLDLVVAHYIFNDTIIFTFKK